MEIAANVSAGFILAENRLDSIRCKKCKKVKILICFRYLLDRAYLAKSLYVRFAVFSDPKESKNNMFWNEINKI